jgi:putative transposase
MKNRVGFARPQRRSVRLRGYDYAQTGAYFVTICSYNRESLFGEITEADHTDGSVGARHAVPAPNPEMRLNALGLAAEACWAAIVGHFSDVILDEYIVMPNHIHGIVVITGAAGTACRAPTTEQFGRPTTGSLPTIIRSFKSAVTKQINEMPDTSPARVWQRGYYERVIRDERELDRIREYIVLNPAHWAEDKHNPVNLAAPPTEIPDARATIAQQRSRRTT